jgi:EAL domain-containing protein (putative c-di-GMP-specific phosphodiesterase class I)
LIVPLGFWVLNEVCRQLKIWRQTSPVLDGLPVSVNLSARQLHTPELAESIGKIIREHGVDAHSIILEITETVMIRDAETSIPVLEQLRGMGLRLHMDDFGIGYSALGCLHRFPLTGLKIDQSFVCNISQRRDYASVVQAIVTLAQNLGMSLVAEGIETYEQVVILRAMGCDMAQGFYFSMPLEAAQVKGFVEGRVVQKPALPAAAA